MSKLQDDVFKILRTRNTKEIDKVAEAAFKNKGVRDELLDGLTSQDDFYRYNCFRTMQLVTAKKPDLIYPSWDKLVTMLDSENSYHQNIAACLLANLTAADKANKFDKVFARYFELLESQGLILARFVAQGAGKIALNKPKLQSKITEKLLAVEKSRQKQKELIKTDVINSFNQYIEEANDKETILAFVAKQTKSKSPKTQKAAKVFLKNHKLAVS